MDLEAFELVLLRRPENPPDYDDAELEHIQREHLAHHARLRASGQVVTNGPVIEPPDPSLRGPARWRRHGGWPRLIPRSGPGGSPCRS
jgi:hypothetical protein